MKGMIAVFMCYLTDISLHLRYRTKILTLTCQIKDSTSEHDCVAMFDEIQLFLLLQ